MKKTILMLMVLLGSSSNLFADEFVVKSFEEDLTDLSARRYERVDVNDDPCAIIKVRTDLKALIFDSNMGIEDIEQKEGEYWLYVSPNEKRLTISKEGFIKLPYIVPVAVKSNNVYVMVLTNKGGEIEIADKDLVEVVFKLNEAEVFISKDNGAPLKAKAKAAVFKLPKGQHKFKFIKEGFADETKDIYVEKNETINVEMKPGTSRERMRLPGILMVSSDPKGTEVFLNDQKLGETPLTDELIAGEYTLVLRKKLYYSHTSRFTLEEGESKQIPAIVLKPRFAVYTIRTTPEDANVYIDGKRLDPTSRTKQRIESGSHTIRVEKRDYHPRERTVALKDGDDETFAFDLIPTFGEVAITTRPENAGVYLDGVPIGNTPIPKRRIKSGTYRLEIEKALYHSKEMTLQIKDGEDRNLSFDLDPAFAVLVVRSEPEQGAAVIIDGKKVGTTPYVNQKHPSGTYTVRVEKDLWLGSEKSVTVRDGETAETTFVLIKNFAKLRATSKSAALYLNNEQIGKDEFSKKLLPGRYAVKAVKPKHHDAEKQVFLKAGDEEIIQLKPEPKLGSVSIISKPPDTKGARIFVDDEEQKGKPSPAVLPLLIGDYKITLKHPRYLDSSQRVSLAEREQKKLVFNMQTYTGSMLQKANRWRTQKWIGFVSGFALLGAGFYCNVTANGYYDDYQAARDIDGAVEARDNTERFDQYRNYSYYVSVAPLVYGMYSWIRQSSYQKRSR